MQRTRFPNLLFLDCRLPLDTLPFSIHFPPWLSQYPVGVLPTSLAAPSVLPTGISSASERWVPRLCCTCAGSSSAGLPEACESCGSCFPTVHSSFLLPLGLKYLTTSLIPRCSRDPLHPSCLKWKLLCFLLTQAPSLGLEQAGHPLSCIYHSSTWIPFSPKLLALALPRSCPMSLPQIPAWDS